MRALRTSCSATSRFVRPGRDEEGDLALARGQRGERAVGRVAGGPQDAMTEPAQLADRLVAAAQRAEAVERRLGRDQGLDRLVAATGGGERPALGEPGPRVGERGARREAARAASTASSARP